MDNILNYDSYIYFSSFNLVYSAEFEYKPRTVSKQKRGPILTTAIA
jgi:hypothetical protein